MQHWGFHKHFVQLKKYKLMSLLTFHWLCHHSHSPHSMAIVLVPGIISYFYAPAEEGLQRGSHVQRYAVGWLYQFKLTNARLQNLCPRKNGPQTSVNCSLGCVSEWPVWETPPRCSDVVFDRSFLVHIRLTSDTPQRDPHTRNIFSSLTQAHTKHTVHHTESVLIYINVLLFTVVLV